MVVLIIIWHPFSNTLSRTTCAQSATCSAACAGCL